MYQFISKANLPTVHGDFIIHAFENEHGQEHVLLSVGLPSTDPDKIPLIRIHSECLTGDAFGSLKCDCGPQLNTAMQMIQAHGCGAILYLRQEGRGIGLVNKIRAYALQDQGHDTLDANLMLGLPADARTYEMCEIMLKHVDVTKLSLMTNNPNKVNDLKSLGLDVVERVPLIVGVNPHNQDYLNVKDSKMGHLINHQ
ncbi:GTP cyclohydrolase II [Moraxella bovis]|uniref:GTP cyclohydrolase-2 n=1 Tax=Moraxella bovis TaxID=476 RepID=A0AAQ2Q831_MORBO|nr:GTP cyclohydrolase II [Moraxella bovis]UYZ67954.1 GTP cyclohydrolase II [Moraxella bovis]UYZ70329.1 GTP cyclohydrolase II [Moraxella bovis]UYZ73761.1 GTP cyclohydrolase II [Moraxella bovis]UYZ75197.1 GTP cyclohydrolase II [Moraxella bovis]UYZ78871.1 GTP cyclohydrolase II [Moraxella bovis]